MYKQAVILLLMLFTASVSAALPARYMQTIENAAVWAQIGDKMVTVGNIRAGQIIAVEPTAASYYAFNFGFGKGFIDKGHLEPVQGRQKVEDGLGDLNKPLSNQNLITWKDTPVYNAPSAGSAPFGVLADNLRYPILHKLKDRLNQTWYQVRIGDRLAYISALDAQPDNGLPVLTYHHILRDEENTRFRHTSTTTSVRAFNNQMAWLRDRGYATLSMAQLEGYVKNKINLPARAVVITFDDGLKSVSRYAYPVLKQYGMKATAFIVTSRIKRHPQKWDPKSLQFMSVSELNEIRDVFDFQSHTHFLHRVDGYRRPILLSRSEHNILFDFARSRRALAQFNPHVWYLSYPFGGFNDKAVKAAKEAGFHLAVTTMKGKVKPGDNPLLLKRLYILRTDSLETMSRLVSNQPQGGLSGNLYRNRFRGTFHFVVAFKIGDVGPPGASFFIWHGNEAGDDDNIADAGAVGRRTVNGNNSRTAFCRDGIGGETLAVGHIPDINGFVFENTGCVKKILVNGARTFIVQVRMSHFHAVEFALQHRANHNFYLSTLSLTKQAMPALRKFSRSIARFLFSVYSSDGICISSLRTAPKRAMYRL
ncbi:polysaccharide deacetylase family protein [Escherichia coli 5-366-08_S1_C1]|nr:polysaccharide deacetylase family protein [Escherichia coli 5-366-08_S1_C1]